MSGWAGGVQESSGTNGSKDGQMEKKVWGRFKPLNLKAKSAKDRHEGEGLLEV